MSVADDRAICEAATPGPWGGSGMTPGGFRNLHALDGGPGGTNTLIAQLRGQNRKCDANFIAHFNPAYVARLLDVVEAADGLDYGIFGEQSRDCLRDALAALKAVDDA